MKLSKFLSILLITCLLLGVKDVQAMPRQGNTLEQPVPKPIRKIVKAIAKGNVFVLHEPEQASPLVTKLGENYFLLSKLATSYELEDLIRTHKNPVVRMYAFKALTTQVRDIPETIMNIINNDTASIKCINREKTDNVELKDLVQNFLN